MRVQAFAWCIADLAVVWRLAPQLSSPPVESSATFYSREHLNRQSPVQHWQLYGWRTRRENNRIRRRYLLTATGEYFARYVPAGKTHAIELFARTLFLGKTTASQFLRSNRAYLVIQVIIQYDVGTRRPTIMVRLTGIAIYRQRAAAARVNIG